jgi:hypothetical protein
MVKGKFETTILWVWIASGSVIELSKRIQATRDLNSSRMVIDES